MRVLLAELRALREAVRAPVAHLQEATAIVEHRRCRGQEVEAALLDLDQEDERAHRLAADVERALLELGDELVVGEMAEIFHAMHVTREISSSGFAPGRAFEGRNAHEGLRDARRLAAPNASPKSSIENPRKPGSLRQLT